MISAVVATLAVTWALVLWHRLEHVADAEHEARGALTVVGLAVARHGDAELTAAYESQLARVRGVPDAVVLGNLVANAAEHGEGPVAVRVEVVNRVAERSLATYGRHSHHKSPLMRGRGLRIAARAARAAGGRLDVREDGGRFAAAVELPVER